MDKVPDNVIDKKLYREVKKEIYQRIPKHSAYRSGLIVKTYKERGGKYKGEKDDEKGLGRWFDEDWRNQRGEIGYSKKGDIYRPTKKINSKTPLLIQQLTKAEIEKARQEKAEKGRVSKYGK